MTSDRLSGIHMLALRTPFRIGDVNAFLIEGDPLTLIDCGPNWASSLLVLERKLEALGYTVGDLELILITHQHLDHLGLAELLLGRSGAQAGCFAPLAPFVRDFVKAAGRDDDLALELMLAHGVAPQEASTLRRFAHILRQFGSSFDASVALEPGSLVDAGSRQLRVVHTPGHSPSDTIFVDEDAGIAFGGDHLLVKTSSNPIIANPLDGPPASAADRPRPLPTYLDSLRATRDLGLDLVLPGHGPIVEQPEALIDERLAFHEERAAIILEIVRRRPTSAHEIAVEIWGSVASSDAYLTLCEVLGHLDVLGDRGLVVEDASGPVSAFTSV